VKQPNNQLQNSIMNTTYPVHSKFDEVFFAGINSLLGPSAMPEAFKRAWVLVFVKKVGDVNSVDYLGFVASTRGSSSVQNSKFQNHLPSTETKLQANCGQIGC
jgi:hypothetical protein